MLDPYDTLGVKSTASATDIKKAYRLLARKHHPDIKPGDKRAEERFKDISSAYDLLSNPSKRRQFDDGEIDAMGNKRAGFGGGASHGYGTYKRNAKNGSRNPFNSFFKDRAGTNNAKQTQSIKAKGADVSYTLKVSFMDAANGADKTVRMTSGKTLRVRIPEGTEHGQNLRLKGQGMQGLGGGKAGDAIVEIHIEDDAQFTSEGLDVFSEEAVTLPEALLGGRIEVKTTHGPVLVTVPEGSNTGTKLRLKAKGLHKPGTATRGDHYVTLKIVLPEDESVDLKKFVKKWSQKNPYKVRNETLKRNAAE
ncbi:MAG: DnaJ domain-containing protein [Magnetovibrio sp.]|nr:DnaJ domain-containing protein [Magnetovibrio sp.]